MNVRASRELREIAALYATGEITRYTELVAGAAAEATALAGARATALAYGADLVEAADTVYGGGSAPDYPGAAGSVLESAAGEFLQLANWGTENSDTGAAAPAPNCYGYAALYLTDTVEAYEDYRAQITESVGVLTALAARATKYGAGAAATAAAATEPLTGGRAECIANSVYNTLAAQITAEIGEYVLSV